MGQIISESQKITAGNQFNGAVPDGNEDEDYGVINWTAGTEGGLFSCPHAKGADPESNLMAREVVLIKLDLADQSAWDVSINDGSNDVLILEGTTEADVVISDKFLLAPSEKIKITTTGASQALKATVTYNVSRLRG